MINTPVKEILGLYPIGHLTEIVPLATFQKTAFLESPGNFARI